MRLFAPSFTGSYPERLAVEAQGLTEVDAASLISNDAKNLDWENHDPDTLLTLRNKLAALDTAAGTEQHGQTITKINGIVSDLAIEVSHATRAGKDEVEKIIKAKSLKDRMEVDTTAEYLKNVPHISGMEGSPDTTLTDNAVRSFLLETFGQKMLVEGGSFDFRKISGFLMKYRGSNERLARVNELIKIGIVVETEGSFIVAGDEDDYRVVEAYLESSERDEVVLPDEVAHTFRNRATADRIIGNHCIEDMDGFDYLRDLDLTEQQKRDLYILGTIAHEVAHSIQPVGLGEFEKIFLDEKSPEGQFGVSGYVREYQDDDRNNGEDQPGRLLSEDFAESIRIYVTNADFLKSNFPARFRYISRVFPGIKAGAAIEFV